MLLPTLLDLEWLPEYEAKHGAKRCYYLQDAEHRGHHLDREISNLNIDLDKFHPAFQAVLKMIQGVLFSAPQGFEMVAAVAVRAISKDNTWCYGGDMTHSFEVKAGMMVLEDNHLTIWLRDVENRARYLITSFFYSDLVPMVESEEKSDAKAEIIYQFFKRKILDGYKRLHRQKLNEVIKLLGELKNAQEEEALFALELGSYM